MKIEYIDYGIGNRVDNTIYLNKKLQHYPKLHDAILNHEKKHTSGWNLSDLWLDINNPTKGIKKEYYLFILKHPKSWVNFLPVMFIKGKICIDMTLAFAWAFMIAIFVTIFGLVIGW